MIVNITRLLALIAAATVLGGCNPLYVARAAYEHSQVMWARRSIAGARADERVPAELRAKLDWVERSREFTRTLDLDPGGSFRSFAHVDRSPFVWIVVGSERTSFKLHTWWFPIVGRVPYKGFFDKEDAEAQARSLEKDGLETSVRGADAFSTLGWFDDPILSSSLRHPPVRIANTVIHETVHSTFWISGEVEFNESLANFIGGRGTLAFFTREVAACAAEGPSERCEEAAAQLVLAERSIVFERDLAAVVDALYAALAALYESDVSDEVKLAERARIYTQFAGKHREKYPKAEQLSSVNNAELMQLRVYLKAYPLFEAVHTACGGSLQCLVGIAKKLADDRGDGPIFDEFRELACKELGLASLPDSVIRGDSSTAS